MSLTNSLSNESKLKKTSLISKPISRQNTSTSTISSTSDSKPILDRSKTYLVKPNGENKQPESASKKPPIISTKEDEKESTNKMSLAEFKQKKRAEISKTKSSTATKKSDSTLSNPLSVEKIIQKGYQSGVINLSDFSLIEIPSSVWNPTKEGAANLSMDDPDAKWWEQVELTKLILASNKIKTIPKEIKCLTALTSLDVHDNQLEAIDEAIGELSLIQMLNLSHNNLKTLPNNLCELRRIQTLNLSHNKISLLPKYFGQIDDLEDLDLSHNCFEILPKSFGWLTKLRRINLQANSLKALPPEVFNSTHLKIVDLSENQLAELPKELGELMHVEQLFLRQNKLTSLPYLQKCCKLKDWDISFNKIAQIEDDCFNNLVSLVNFNLRDNQLTVIPKTIKSLQALERLDLSNNNLSNLPCELAAIESLKQLLLVGNPLRTIRKDIINRGSEAIMKHLRNQLSPESLNTSGTQEPDENLLRSDIIKSTKVFDLSCKKLTSVTSNMISFCRQSTALVLNLSKNQLQDLPDELEQLSQQLNELNLSMNLFTNLPRVVFTLTNLVTLDLRGNQFKEIPNEISKLKSLRELTIADNKLVEIPAGIYELPILENLFANNNKIKTVDPFKIISMRFLSTLNLQNNDILNLPIELGKADHLKSLQLEGNPFRCPRPQILAKGTPAILEYLRGRLTES